MNDSMPPIEISRQKVTARLEAEGWAVRHGGAHDVYKHPDRKVVSSSLATGFCRGASPALSQKKQGGSKAARQSTVKGLLK